MEAEAKLEQWMLVEGWTPLLLCVAATHSAQDLLAVTLGRNVGVIRAQIQGRNIYNQSKIGRQFGGTRPAQRAVCRMWHLKFHSLFPVSVS